MKHLKRFGLLSLCVFSFLYSSESESVLQLSRKELSPEKIDAMVRTSAMDSDIKNLEYLNRVMASVVKIKGGKNWIEPILKKMKTDEGEKLLLEGDRLAQQEIREIFEKAANFFAGYPNGGFPN